MSAVMTFCPATGRSVSTAIEMEPDDFRRLPRLAATMHCPACGREHVWLTNVAWLDGYPRLVELPIESAAA